ncbi:hypothetical protein OEA41_009824 [Lepraria neglecta]|uniref:Uncharacterized protein n=1 Tax=Lepraria neglecta TaxID=209136 RepID=A0AAD9YVE4_9LECA|nr:hypothetical protein OEA41_009824 [Lepraria neglecta]
MYVYSGHGVGGPGVFDTFWLGDDRPSVNAPRIDWQVLRNMADAAPGDTLYILDCRGAASAALRANGNENMCASAIDSVASSILSESFTRRFIDLLKRYQHTPMSVAALHSEMWFEAGEPSTYLETNPVHFGASSTGHSIFLQPLKKEPKDLQKLKQESAASVGKVLVTLPDEPAFEKWLLTMIPPNLRDIRVQAVFDSDSMLILVTIPIVAWDMLKEDGTICLLQAQERGLPERVRPRGKENQPFGGSSSGAKNVK